MGHSRQSSFQSISSESIPVSPVTFSFGHVRHHSSSSSLSTSPPRRDSLDQSCISKRSAPSLPKVAEAPEERETAHEAANDTTRECSFEVIEPRDWSTLSYYGNNTPVEYDIRDSFYYDTEPFSVGEPATKRRRSAIGAFDDFAERVVSRFPSFSRRTRSRKRSSTVSSASDVAALPPPPTSPQVGRSRSTSRARSIFRRSQDLGAEQAREAAGAQPFGTIAEDEEMETVAPSSAFFDVGKHSSDEESSEQRAQTPLLPPVMREQRSDSPVSSPLDSPTIAPKNPHSQEILRRHPGSLSPPLSAQPSTQSFRQQLNLPHQLTPTSEIPPMLIEDTYDEWSDRLGHANFHIHPAPYVPDPLTEDSCKQLWTDWSQARKEFSKHLARTSTHFGETSKVYKLTEEKWASIDRQWKKCLDSAHAEAAAKGIDVTPNSPDQPEPIFKIPNMDDPQGEGKWPKLGDSDIVGPMHVAAPKAEELGAAPCQLKRRESKKDRVMRLFSGLGRLSTGAPSR